MNRELTKHETIMLGIFFVILLGLCYYRFILTPINDTVDRCNSEIQTELSKQVIAQGTVMRIRKMEKEIDAAKSAGNVTPIPAYNNLVALGKELDNILSATNDYMVDFVKVVTTDEIVQRYVTISFETPNYEAASNIIRRLHDSKHVNQISDINMDTGLRAWYSDRDYHTKTTLSIVFFEIIPEKR